MQHKINVSAHQPRTVSSNQTTVHNKLDDVVRRHQQHPFRKPPAAHTRAAFVAVTAQLEAVPRPLILDSGCGTGMSTRYLAQAYPECWVIGVDRSQARLEKKQAEPFPANALRVRADLVDFWLLAAQAGWRLQQHFILYPNPYPKSTQLQRRWHAHPVFPSLLQLGGRLELRTNWQIYAEEFALALRLSGYPQAGCRHYLPPQNGQYQTLFEKKYHEAGQALFVCSVRCGSVL